jgi:hypothetical protein
MSNKVVSDLTDTFNFEYENLSEFNKVILNKLSSSENIKWEFFHPFFYIILNKYKHCRMGDAYYDKINNIVISHFEIKNISGMTVVDTMSMVYSYIDELCGLFVYMLDENFFVTTGISIESTNNNIGNYDENEILNFVCMVNVLEIKQVTNTNKKISLRFNFYHVEENRNIKNMKLNLLLSGTSAFQRPKMNVPMSKF